jgi:exopolysaccharide production protein ExoY
MRLTVVIHNPADIQTSAEYEIEDTLGGRSKRILDLILSLIAMALLLPFMMIIAVLIFFFDGGPAIICHERIGRKGKRFNCLKFRTMVKNGDDILRAYLNDNHDAHQEWAENRKLKNDPRITGIGRILRKTSLDELPQIINIFIGDMSVVGPRPIVYEEIKKYGSAFLDYRKTRPGLTGLWQISGRNNIAYDERIDLDQSYIKNWSFRLDLMIILKTIPAVIRAKGVY